ncbi:MAG: hypothetical protein QOF06_2146 [Solirubrobacterales bacterium]|nr:hypothetical protein [Solirubrobacterales bacterium]
MVGGVALLLLLVFVAGCGSDSGTSGETETKPARFAPRVHGPSREFLIPGGDNVVQLFGREAAPAEREEASRVIHVWMRARVAEDWKEACKYLAAVYAKGLIEDAKLVSKGKATNCPQTLSFFGDEASGSSGNTLTGPIDSMRLRGNRAFVQWHGPNQIDWILPMRYEDGGWKVSSASPVERTK